MRLESLPTLVIERLTAPDWQIEALAHHDMAIEAELFPEDPEYPLANRVAFFRTPSNGEMQNRILAILDGDCVAAKGYQEWRLKNPEDYTVFTRVSVLPAYRRRGLAARLVGEMEAHARAIGRDTLIFNTTDSCPAARPFLEHIGAQAGLENHINQLDLSKVDRGLMQSWVDRAPSQVYILRFWEGLPPDELMGAYCDMYSHFIDSRPHGALDPPRRRMTPEILRDRQAFETAQHTHHWVLVALCEANDESHIVGFTEIFHNDDQPTIIGQGGTSVFMAYRGQGIGRWLKAKMILKVLDELLRARFVRTSNADSNAAMLKINTEMGFVHYMAETDWQKKLVG